jgi:putative transposase
MNQLGIQAIYPKKRTTVRNPEHQIYPYLLGELSIEKANQVWCTDITYLFANRKRTLLSSRHYGLV